MRSVDGDNDGQAVQDVGAFEFQIIDFGDAPETFPTLNTDNGASHQAVGPRLGQNRDGEENGLPSPDALGDDFSGGPDDEDGVMFGAIKSGSTMAGVNIDLQDASAARIDAWMDFNQNGTWDLGEQILDSVPVIGGLQTLNYMIPSTLVSGEMFARVRVSSAGGLDPDGPAVDGEVEDYRVVINAPVVESVVINDGGDSRSQVTSITLTFSEELAHANLGTAFALYNSTDDVSLNTPTVSASDVGGQTQVTLTFAGNSVDERQGTGVLGNSLSDGNYLLFVDRLKIVSASTSLPMTENLIYGDRAEDKLFRLLGDSDGDRDVDGQDYGRFGLTFLKSSVDAAFNGEFDSDGDGDVDGQDYGRFGLRFLSSLPF